MREYKNFKEEVWALIDRSNIIFDINYNNLEKNSGLAFWYVENGFAESYIDQIDFDEFKELEYYKKVEPVALSLITIYDKFYEFFYTNNSYTICKKLNRLATYERVVAMYSDEEIKELLYNEFLDIVDLKLDFVITKQNTIRVKNNKKLWKVILCELLDINYILK